MADEDDEADVDLWRAAGRFNDGLVEDEVDGALENEVAEGTTDGVGFGFRMETIFVLVLKEAGLNGLVDAPVADLGPNLPRLFFVKEESASSGGGRRNVVLLAVGIGRGRLDA